MDDKDRGIIEDQLGGDDDVVTQEEYSMWMADSDEVKDESDQEEPEGETLDFNRPHFKFTPKPRHNWVQKGYYLHCTSCELMHGEYIGDKKLMVGMKDNGDPILKLRSEVGMA